MLFYEGLMIVYLIFCMSPRFSHAKYAGECTTPMEQPGKCMPLQSCASAYALFRDIQRTGGIDFTKRASYLQRSQCDFQRGVPYVCCPEEHIQMNSKVMNHLAKLDCGTHANWKIANGDEANLFHYRWTSMLLYNGFDGPVCNGALIDDRHVLTAAHCLHDLKELPYAVRLGEYNRSSAEDCVQLRRTKLCLGPTEDIEIEEIIPHEDYIYQSIHHDIAILRLKRSVKFAKHIRPICLPITKELQDAKVEDYVAAGWGRTEKDKKGSEVLLFTHLPKQPNEFCNKKLQLELTEEHICAGGKGFHDTCKGDSGGALFRPDLFVDGVARQIQYGIVSIGVNSCGQSTFPAVYTNVPHYLQWITDHMKIDDLTF